MSDVTKDPVGFDMTITDERTEIRVSGDIDTAVIVRSKSGEKIYLPPENYDRKLEPKTAYETPYDGMQSGPYGPQHEPDSDSVSGLKETADGYLIVHDEPVTDVRFLR